MSKAVTESSLFSDRAHVDPRAQGEASGSSNVSDLSPSGSKK